MAGRSLDYRTKSFIKRVTELHGSRLSFEKTTYVNKNTQLTVTCKTHGDFKTYPESLLRSKTGCPWCGKRVNKKEFIEKAKKVHGDEYDYSRVKYVNTTTPVEIVCRKHGSFWQAPYVHYSRKNRCPTCAVLDDRLTVDEFIDKARAIHGDKYDYSLVVYETNNSMVDIVCPKHGKFTQVARSHLRGNGCKQCYLERNKLSKEEFIKNSRAVHGDVYDYSQVVYRGNKKPVKIICPEHGAFYKTPNSHVSSRSGCPTCIESKGERRIRVFLEKHGIPYRKEYKIEPYLYRYDFYLPEQDIFIEFHGQQHFRPIEMFGGQEAFERVKENDQIKKQILKARGSPLIVLSYMQTKDDMLERALVSGLKRCYRYWLRIDGVIRVFRTHFDIWFTYNLPEYTKAGNVLERLRDAIGDFEILF